MEELFLKYIQSRQESSQSGSNHVSGIKSISEKYLGKDLFLISSPSEIEDIIYNLENNAEFISANRKGHNMYLRALKHYKEFLSVNNTILYKNNGINLSMIQKYLAAEMLLLVNKNNLRVEYGELANLLKDKYNIEINPHTQMPHLIGGISKICYINLNLPMLSCIVVNKETQLPGIGFYKLYDELHNTNYVGKPYFEKKCREEVKKEILNCNEWYKLADYLNIEIDNIYRPNTVQTEKTNSNINNGEIKEIEQKLIKEIEKEELGETEKETLIKVRIGQSQLRENVINTKKICEICGLSHNKLLIASHIKPWAKSDNNEKLDSENILLLCSMHDALFDKGLISFYDDGKILISRELNNIEQALVNINEDSCIDIRSDKQKEYLKYHREHIFIN